MLFRSLNKKSCARGRFLPFHSPNAPPYSAENAGISLSAAPKPCFPAARNGIFPGKSPFARLSHILSHSNSINDTMHKNQALSPPHSHEIWRFFLLFFYNVSFPDERRCGSAPIPRRGSSPPGLNLPARFHAAGCFHITYSSSSRPEAQTAV